MPTLVQIDAWDPVTAAVVSLLSCSHDDPSVCHLGGNTWWPTIAKLPALRYDLFDGAFGSQITAPSSTISLQTEPWPFFGRYILADARFRLWHGSLGDPASAYVLRFDGRVSAQPKIQDGRADIDFAVDDRWLDTSLLTLYAGTTGVEGPAALKGQAKPLALGAPRYVSGKLIDSVNSVFQVSAYGAVNGFEAALEKLARFPAPIGDYPTYAALVAASIPAGQWATANAVGMARFGAPPTGQISFLLQGDAAGADGWARTAGKLIRRLAALSGGAGRTDDASLNALDAARPYNLSIYLDAQTTAREVIQKLAASVNAVAGVSWTGQLFVAPVAVGAATVTLAADGSSLPAISSVQQIDIAAPFQKLAIDAERAWTVHDLADIAFTATVVDLGLYAAGTSYREGNVVNLSDGSRWLFVATTPASGSAPATGNANWSRMTGPTAAVYGDGTSIEVLKPAQAGADKTASNTAAGVAGQGALATMNSAAYGSQYLTGFGGLAPLSSISLGGTYLYRQDGSTKVTDANAITALGVASGFAGQGLFATLNSAGYGSQYLTGFGALAPLAAILLGSSFLFRADGSTKVTDATAITALGTAASIAGQGLFATLNSAGYGSQYLTGFGALAPLGTIAFNSTYLLTSGGAQATDAAYQTAQGTAAAITGQSAFATFTGTTPGALLAPSSNMIVDSTFRFNGLGWTLGPGFGFSRSGYDSNGFLYNTGNSGTTIAYGPSFTVAGSAAYCLQAEMAYSGSTNSMSVDIEWTDSSANKSYSSRLQLGPNGIISGADIPGRQGNYYSLFVALTSPPSAVTARVRCFTENGNGSCYWRRLKLALGTNPTPWSDEATTSARYGSDGALLDTLRPQEIGSNVTENRASAAIAGQGALATRNSVTLNTTTIYRADGTTIVSETLVITNQGTAAAIAGQGPAATLSTVTDLIALNDTNTYTGSGPAGSGSAAGGSGGSTTKQGGGVQP